ncbi:MAG: hypothetical protein HOO06_12665 [Bdellovibrionaceae bacterium]|nr:hypothetical protein [Pseudobdellovibrionaceae bacterium]
MSQALKSIVIVFLFLLSTVSAAVAVPSLNKKNFESYDHSLLKEIYATIFHNIKRNMELLNEYHYLDDKYSTADHSIQKLDNLKNSLSFNNGYPFQSKHAHPGETEEYKQLNDFLEELSKRIVKLKNQSRYLLEQRDEVEQQFFGMLIPLSILYFNNINETSIQISSYDKTMDLMEDLRGLLLTQYGKDFRDKKILINFPKKIPRSIHLSGSKARTVFQFLTNTGKVNHSYKFTTTVDHEVAESRVNFFAKVFFKQNWDQINDESSIKIKIKSREVSSKIKLCKQIDQVVIGKISFMTKKYLQDGNHEYSENDVKIITEELDLPTDLVGVRVMEYSCIIN